MCPVLFWAFSSVQFSHSVVSNTATPWIAAHQASLSITNSQSLPKLMSIESVMPSNHLIYRPLLLLPSIFPSIRVFSYESALHISSVQFSSVAQSCPTLSTPWTTARQASLFITNSRSSPKPMYTESVMPFNRLILCRSLLLLPSIFPSIRSAFKMEWVADAFLGKMWAHPWG